MCVFAQPSLLLLLLATQSEFRYDHLSIVGRSLGRYRMGQCIVDDCVIISSEQVSAIIQIKLCY